MITHWGGLLFVPHLYPIWGTWGTYMKSGVQSGVHVTCKFPTVRVRGGGLPGTDGRPRAGGRLPDGQGGRERATATERTEPQRNGRNRNGTEPQRNGTEQNKKKQKKYIHKFISINDL